MSRSLNIPETDKLVWDSVIDVHKKSSILKEEVYRLRFEENMTQAAIGKLKGISQSTVYRLLSEQKEHISSDELN